MKVSTFEECINLMKKGERNRTVRQTSMNVKSSRSHTIFQFVVEEVFQDKSYRVRSQLNNVEDKTQFVRLGRLLKDQQSGGNGDGASQGTQEH